MTYLRLDLTGSCEGSVNFTHDDLDSQSLYNGAEWWVVWKGGVTYMLDGEEDKVDGENR